MFRGVAQSHFDKVEGILAEVGIEVEMDLENEHNYFQGRKYDIFTLLLSIEEDIGLQHITSLQRSTVQDYYAFNIFSTPSYY